MQTTTAPCSSVSAARVSWRTKQAAQQRAGAAWSTCPPTGPAPHVASVSAAAAPPGAPSPSSVPAPVASATAFREFEHAGWSDPSLAHAYAQSFGSLTSQAAPALLRAVRAGPGTRLLDVACGPGYVAAAAAAAGCHVTGLDFSPAMVQQATASHSGIAFVVGDAETLQGIEDESLDAVTVNFGLLHLAQPELALRQAHRVLRQGGRLAYTVWADPATDAQAVGMRLVTGALKAHGNANVPLPDGPPFFRFANARLSMEAAEAAGFAAGSTEVQTLPLVWRLARPQALVAAFRDGGVRMGALLRGQSAEASAAILRAVEEGAAPYRAPDGGAYLIQMPCVMTSTVKK